MRQKQPIPGSIVAPKFATEAEEAEWWFRDRRIHDKTFHEAVKSGRAQTLSKEKLLERIAAEKKKTASPVVALRIRGPDSPGEGEVLGTHHILPEPIGRCDIQSFAANQIPGTLAEAQNIHESACGADAGVNLAEAERRAPAVLRIPV